MKSAELENALEKYLIYLAQEERSTATRSQYRRDILKFLEFLEGKQLNKETALLYKQHLEETYRQTSVNAKLAALNSFFVFLEKKELCLKLLKIQTNVYCPEEKELSKEEYQRLVKTARAKKNEKLALMLQTICSTGIRVSELKYVTVEAVQKGEAVIHLKGKTRTILIPGKLKKALKRYIRSRKLRSGAVFITRTGNPMNRSNIWKMMKNLCKDAEVEEKKVFPHNLRHLFARTFYDLDKDIARLADILGHSNINTTRIYIISTGREHRRKLDAMGLVV